MVSPILRINFDDKIFNPSSRFFTWKFEILFAISSGWPIVVIENIWTRFNHIKRSDLRIILTHAGSRISFIQADFLLIPPAIAIPSGHVSSSCFPRFILLPPASARARFCSFFDSRLRKRGVKGDRPEGVWGWLDTHNRYSHWSSWRSNHQPPTTDHLHYLLPLSFCGSNWLPFILCHRFSPVFFYSSPLPCVTLPTYTFARPLSPIGQETSNIWFFNDRLCV